MKSISAIQWKTLAIYFTQRTDALQDVDRLQRSRNTYHYIHASAHVCVCATVWVGGWCVVWCGVVWCGVMVWCGVVWCGVVWCGVVWCGVVCDCACNCVCVTVCQCLLFVVGVHSYSAQSQ